MATITTRSGKGSPLTNNEVDANFTNLNNDKQEVLAEGSFADGDKTKLDGIESGATADQTAQEIATAIDADATAEATLKSALGLGTAAYTASTDYATAAQGALADSALQSIPDNYVLNTGDAITGNLTFGDNDKAIFGAGSDLQIYHDGSNSYIQDTGTGHLRLQGTNLRLEDSSGYAFVICTDNGAGGEVSLQHEGNEKLATTSTGIDVTGTVTADGLTVDSSGSINSGSSAGTLTLYGGSTNQGGKIVLDGGNNDGDIVFHAEQYQASPKQRMKIANNGDISFYEDTGTTAKFFWDASEERLGIGTSSPSGKLHIQRSGAGNFLYMNDGVACGMTVLSNSSDLTFKHQSSVGQFVFQNSSGTDRLRIDSSGNVGIGTSSPSQRLHVNGSAYFGTSSSATGNIYLWNSSNDTRCDISNTGSAFNFNATYLSTGGYKPITFNAGGSERMRINSSGNVGIGTSSPSSFSAELAVVKDAGTPRIAVVDSVSSNRGGYIESNGTDSLVIGTTSGVRSIKLSPDNIERLHISTSNYTAFRTTTTEAMRIDSSGNLLVGTTDTDTQNNNAGSSADNGFVYNKGSGGYFNVARYNGTVAYINRTGSDGTISEFRKDGATVGVIGNTSWTDELSIYTSGKSGLTFSTNSIVPANGSGAYVDNSKDLGTANYRFKDLYLSGGVYLGGTGSANYLDDYEEGTWTPLLQAQNTDPTYTSGTNRSTYTKIGRTVYLNLDINLDITAVGSGQRLLSLPFSASGDKSYTSCFGSRNNSAFTLEDYKIQGYCASSYFYMTLQAGANGSEGTLSESHQRTGSSLRICLAIKYLTDS